MKSCHIVFNPNCTQEIKLFISLNTISNTWFGLKNKHCEFTICQQNSNGYFVPKKTVLKSGFSTSHVLLE